jgi:hypothetical protein
MSGLGLPISGVTKYTAARNVPQQIAHPPPFSRFCTAYAYTVAGLDPERRALKCARLIATRQPAYRDVRHDLSRSTSSLARDHTPSSASDSSIARGSTSSNIVCSELANDSASSPRMKTPGQSLPNCIRPVSTLRVSTIFRSTPLAAAILAFRSLRSVSAPYRLRLPSPGMRRMPAPFERARRIAAAFLGSVSSIR